MVMEAHHVETTPAALQMAPASQPWTRIDLDLYEIARDGVVEGYVEVVGHVFVVLVGDRYDRAVEVTQTLTFHDAVAALRVASR